MTRKSTRQEPTSARKRRRRDGDGPAQSLPSPPPTAPSPAHTEEGVPHPCREVHTRPHPPTAPKPAPPRGCPRSSGSDDSASADRFPGGLLARPGPADQPRHTYSTSPVIRGSSPPPTTPAAPVSVSSTTTTTVTTPRGTQRTAPELADKLHICVTRASRSDRWPFLIYRTRFPVQVGLLPSPAESPQPQPSSGETKDEPAAGLHIDDIILRIDGVKPRSHAHAVELFGSAGLSVRLKVRRARAACGEGEGEGEGGAAVQAGEAPTEGGVSPATTGRVSPDAAEREEVNEDDAHAPQGGAATGLPSPPPTHTEAGPATQHESPAHAGGTAADGHEGGVRHELRAAAPATRARTPTPDAGPTTAALVDGGDPSRTGAPLAARVHALPRPARGPSEGSTALRHPRFAPLGSHLPRVAPPSPPPPPLASTPAVEGEQGMGRAGRTAVDVMCPVVQLRAGGGGGGKGGAAAVLATHYPAYGCGGRTGTGLAEVAAHMTSTDAETCSGLAAAVARLPTAPRAAVYDRAGCPFHTDAEASRRGGFTDHLHRAIQSVLTAQALASTATPASQGAPGLARGSAQAGEDALLLGAVDLVASARRALNIGGPGQSGSRATVRAKVQSLAADEDARRLRACLAARRAHMADAHAALCEVVARHQVTRGERKERAAEALRTCEASAAAARHLLSEIFDSGHGRPAPTAATAAGGERRGGRGGPSDAR